MSDFFLCGSELAAICFPYKLYARKLALIAATLTVRFAAVDNSTQMLAFQVLLNISKLHKATDQK